MSASNNVFYKGPSLPCTGIDRWDSATIALQKLEQALCESTAELAVLYNEINNISPFPPTTTTTTTTL